MKYVLIGVNKVTKARRSFEISAANYAEFNDNPDPMKSTGVKKLKEDIKKSYPGKRFTFSLSSKKE